MGRIQRQPAQVQLDFINLCCKYWNKEGSISIEDAKLDIMDSYEPLLKYKIIKEGGDNVVIDFLDEQLSAIEDKRKQASDAGKLSAAARKRRTKLNKPSTTVERPLNEQPTESNREEKSRVEENREETKGRVFFQDEKLNDAFSKWLKMCKEKNKDYPPSAIEALQMKLNTAKKPLEMVSQSLERGWVTLRPVEDNSNTFTKPKQLFPGDKGYKQAF